LNATPFEALYGFPPPLISQVMIPGPDSPALEFLQQKQQILKKLKDNLAQTQARIKKFVDQKRSER
jgi:hypothetical protein